MSLFIALAQFATNKLIGLMRDDMFLTINISYNKGCIFINIIIKPIDVGYDFQPDNNEFIMLTSAYFSYNTQILVWSMY